MPDIRVDWDSAAKNYVLAEFRESWEWEDFYDAFRRMHELIVTVDYTVDLIIVHHVALPAGPPAPHFKAAMREQPANAGTAFVVPRDTSMSTSILILLASVFQRLYPRKSPIILVRSLEEAQQRVTRHAAA